MLISKTYTPALEAEATILPLLPPALRTQALRLLVQLSERGRSIETNQGGRPREVSLSGVISKDSFWDCGPRKCNDGQDLSVKIFRLLQWLPNRDDTQSQVAKLPP